MFKQYAVFCALIAFSLAAISQYPPSKSPDHSESCLFGEAGLVIPIGETRNHPKLCAEISCNKDYSMTLATCGVTGVGDGCRLLPSDLSLPYPECCPKVECI